MSQYNIVLFSGNSNIELSEYIAKKLRLKLSGIQVSRFSDGEIQVEIPESVRGNDVYVIQSTCPPHVSDSLMEVLVMIDAIKRSSAKRITAVLPYFGYARQDRRPWSKRVPITARLVANMLTEAGAERVLTIDLHTEQIQGFFNIPVDNLYASPVFADIIKKNVTNPTVVSPDVGGVLRARAFAKQLSTDMVIVDKRRDKSSKSEVMNIIGDVVNKNCVIIDDIVDTAGTICKSAKALKQQGAKSVIACCTHGVLSKSAVNVIEKSELDSIYISNTIPLKKAYNGNKIKPVCISHIIARSIRHIHREDSISSIYPNNWNDL